MLYVRFGLTLLTKNLFIHVPYNINFLQICVGVNDDRQFHFSVLRKILYSAYSKVAMPFMNELMIRKSLLRGQYAWCVPVKYEYKIIAK